MATLKICCLAVSAVIFAATASALWMVSDILWMAFIGNWRVWVAHAVKVNATAVVKQPVMHRPPVPVVEKIISPPVMEIERPALTLWWKKWSDFVLSYTVEDLMVLAATVCLVIVGLCAVVVALQWVKRGFYAVVQWSRGVKKTRFNHVIEAKIVGSDYHSGKPPNFQVAVHQLGLFSDTFVGYAIRSGDFLLMPRHVYEYAECKPVLVTPKMRVVLETKYLQLTHPDMVAFPLGSAQWANLGVSSCTLAHTMDSSLTVSCFGQQGYTTGLLTKSAGVIGCVLYSGSTEQGMSGAAYVKNGVVYGQHLGVFGDDNGGVSSLTLKADLRKLVKQEGKKRDGWGYKSLTGDNKIVLSSGDGSIEGDAATKRKHAKPDWTEKEVEQMVESGEMGTWAAGMELEDIRNRTRNEGVDPVSRVTADLTKMSISEKKAIAGVVNSMINVAEVTKVVPLGMADVPQGVPSSLPDRVANLENAVAALMNMVIRLQSGSDERNEERETAPPKAGGSEVPPAKSANAKAKPTKVEAKPKLEHRVPPIPPVKTESVPKTAEEKLEEIREKRRAKRRRYNARLAEKLASKPTVPEGVAPQVVKSVGKN